MSCQQCHTLDIEWLIRSPDELTKAIRIVRANLDDGTLEEVGRPGRQDTQSFRDLPEEGPWPDYVEGNFRCASCGTRFQLAVETYHGAGGRWCPIMN